MRSRNGANILLALRDGRAKDWGSLVTALGLDPHKPEHETLLPEVLGNLHALRKLGLVAFDVADERTGAVEGEIRHLPLWTETQRALGGQRLSDLAALNSDALVVNPLFGRPKAPPAPVDVFVLMPFDASFNPIYDGHIRKIVEALGLQPRRADEFRDPDEIMAGVWAGIGAARLILAECTVPNGNVHYEVGLAHALGKPVILLTQDYDLLPSDIEHISALRYGATSEGLEKFDEELTEWLRQALGKEIR